MLTADGAISSGFDWNDPTDNRDPREVLEAEGVVFEDGRAAAAQRLTAEELANLIETPEDQMNESTGLEEG